MGVERVGFNLPTSGAGRHVGHGWAGAKQHAWPACFYTQLPPDSLPLLPGARSLYWAAGVLGNAELDGAPILVLANKQDLEEASGAAQVCVSWHM